MRTPSSILVLEYMFKEKKFVNSLKISIGEFWFSKVLIGEEPVRMQRFRSVRGPFLL